LQTVLKESFFSCNSEDFPLNSAFRGVSKVLFKNTVNSKDFINKDFVASEGQDIFLLPHRRTKVGQRGEEQAMSQEK